MTLKSAAPYYSLTDCLLLETDIRCSYEWYSANFMEPSYSRTSCFFYQESEHANLWIQTSRSYCIHIDYKLHFLHLVYFLFSLEVKFLWLIRTRLVFPAIDSLLTLRFALVISEMVNASVAFTSALITVSTEVDRILRKSAALCTQYIFSSRGTLLW